MYNPYNWTIKQDKFLELVKRKHALMNELSSVNIKADMLKSEISLLDDEMASMIFSNKEKKEIFLQALLSLK